MRRRQRVTCRSNFSIVNRTITERLKYRGLGPNLYSHTAVRDEMSANVVGVKSSATLEYDLTSEEPPAHVHDVDQLMMLFVTLFTVVHCEPLVASASPHKSL